MSLNPESRFNKETIIPEVETEKRSREIYDLLTDRSKGLNVKEIDGLAELLFKNVESELTPVSQLFGDTSGDIKPQTLDAMVNAIGAKEVFRLIVREACGLSGSATSEPVEEDVLLQNKKIKDEGVEREFNWEGERWGFAM